MKRIAFLSYSKKTTLKLYYSTLTATNNVSTINKESEQLMANTMKKQCAGFSFIEAIDKSENYCIQIARRNISWHKLNAIVRRVAHPQTMGENFHIFKDTRNTKFVYAKIY